MSIKEANEPVVVDDKSLGKPNAYSLLSEELPEISDTDNLETIDEIELNQASDGWMTARGLAREIGVRHGAITARAEDLIAEHPEWSQVLLSRGRPYEHYGPELCAIIRSEFGIRESAPDGWMITASLVDELGVTAKRIQTFVEPYRKDRADQFMMYKDHRGKLGEHYGPELCEIIRNEFGKRETAPDGWTLPSTLAKDLGLSYNNLISRADKHRSEHPDWFKKFNAAGGKYNEHFSPELSELIRSELSELKNTIVAPEGWMTTASLVDELGASAKTIKKIADSLIDEHPGWAKQFHAGTQNRLVLYYSPEICDVLREKLASAEEAPSGWLVSKTLAGELDSSQGTVQNFADTYRTDHPEWFKMYKSAGRMYEHYSPELCDLAREKYGQYDRAPDGWLTVTTLADAPGPGSRVPARRLVEELRPEHPESFKFYVGSNGQVHEYLSPELCALVRKELGEMYGTEYSNAKEVRRRTELEQEMTQYLEGIKDKHSADGREFQNLIDLFGAGSIVDILYQFHPEYRELPLPYVRSMLADYLGEFMVTKGNFTLDIIKENADYLREPNLRASLTSVVKKDCLAFYNKLKQAHPLEDDLGIINLYIASLRSKTTDIDSEDLEAVITDVESYYETLFTGIEKPEQIRDGLASGRDFPDINQRINVQEISQKKRMLIADEMGLGKSASAIIAKETLGARMAVVLAPSNVLDTWRGYLSDQAPEDGRSRGYFKEGQAPRVLMVTSLDDLDPSQAANYDYILISQERLDDDYTAALTALGYDMLIVDEVHKVKNLTEGARAGHVVELASNIEGEDQYMALLSGTPVPNKVGDVAILLKLLHPERFEELTNEQLVSQVINGDVLDIRTLLEDRMQMKSLAGSVEMPNLHERDRKVHLNSVEKEFYEVLLDEDEVTASEKMQLMRKFILNPAMQEASPNLVGSKSQEVNRALNESFMTSDKIVMFFNGYINGVIQGDQTIFDNWQLPEDVEIVTITGDVLADRRKEIQASLAEEGKRILLAVSGQTADTGVDFSEADEVMFYNEPWTEYDKKQQLARVYRFGVKHDIKSTTFYAEGTIEEGIHRYIEAKYQAVEKLLRGVPISEIEQKLLREDEKQDGPNLEVNPELAAYYFSSWDRMMKIYGYVKEIGEEKFTDFVGDWGRDYAEAYTDLGSRSYQANASRLAGTLINDFRTQRGQQASTTRVLDVASGPEMLRQHISDDMSANVYSVDINRHHFEGEGQLRAVGSFKNLPIADASMDYANLSMALHYSNFVPTKGKYERLEVVQELNRVLAPGGRAVISLMYALDLRDEALFRKTIKSCGFEVVDEYSGQTTAGDAFKARLITLEKIAECEQDTEALIEILGSDGLQGLKFSKATAGLKDSRKIATEFELNGRTVETNFNTADYQVFSEEQGLNQALEAMRDMYGSVKAIPEEVLTNSGYSRVYNSKSYILFKKLTTASGAVVVR